MARYQTHHRWRPIWRHHFALGNCGCPPIRDCRLAHCDHGPAAAVTIETVYWNNAVAPPIDEWFDLRAQRCNRCRQCWPYIRCCPLDSISIHMLYYYLKSCVEWRYWIVSKYLCNMQIAENVLPLPVHVKIRTQNSNYQIIYEQITASLEQFAES